MRNTIPFLLLLVLFSCSQKNNDDNIVINFKVSNMTYPTVSIANQRFEETITLDKNGEGRITLQEEAVYATLIYGEEMLKVYFEKGNEITISFDASNLRNSIELEGGLSEIVQYLNKVSLEPVNPEELYRPLEEVSNTIADKIELATDELDRSNLEKDYPHFVKMEQARIKYSYANNLIMYPLVYAMMDSTYMPNQDYYSLLDYYLIEDETILDVEPYREFVMEAALILASKDKPLTTDFDKTEARVEYIAQHFDNDKVIQSFVDEIIARHLNWKGVDDAEALDKLHKKYVTP